MCNSISHDTQETFSTSADCRSDKERRLLPKKYCSFGALKSVYGEHVPRVRVYASSDSLIAKHNRTLEHSSILIMIRNWEHRDFAS